MQNISLWSSEKNVIRLANARTHQRLRWEIGWDRWGTEWILELPWPLLLLLFVSSPRTLCGVFEEVDTKASAQLTKPQIMQILGVSNQGRKLTQKPAFGGKVCTETGRQLHLHRPTQASEEHSPDIHKSNQCERWSLPPTLSLLQT